MEENLVIFLPFYVEEGGGTEFFYTSATHHTATWRKNREKIWIKPKKPVQLKITQNFKYL